MTTISDGIRVEVAFEADPDAATPAWTDATGYVDMSVGINIRQGRTKSTEQPQPGTCSFTLDNRSGKFSPALEGSFPYLIPYRKVRVRWRNPFGGANLLPLSATADTAGWTLANAATVAAVSTGDGYALTALEVSVSSDPDWAEYSFPVVPGRRYVLSGVARWISGSGLMVVAQPASGPGAVGTDFMATTSGWQKFALPFVSTDPTAKVLIAGMGAGVAQFGYLRVDEITATNPDVRVDWTPGTATKYMGDPYYLDRFTGYIDAWPLSWGTSRDTSVTITAADRLARLGKSRPMRSIPCETILSLTPYRYWPCGDWDGAGFSSIAPASADGDTLSPGTVVINPDFDPVGGTGIPTDGASSPAFKAPGTTGLWSIVNLPSLPNISMGAYFNTTATTEQDLLSLFIPSGAQIVVGHGTHGRLTVKAQTSQAAAPPLISTASAGVVNDGKTHSVVAVIDGTGSSDVVKVYLDGTLRTTATLTAFTGTDNYPYQQAAFGAARNWGSNSLTGTLGHCFLVGRALTTTEISDVYKAGLTGFAPESTVTRLGRLWKLGLNRTDTNGTWFNGSCTTVSHYDTTDQDPAGALRAIVESEGGVLYCTNAGSVAALGRDYRSTWSSPATIPAVDSERLSFRQQIDDIANDVSIEVSGTGQTIRQSDEASVASYGYRSLSATIYSTSRNDGNVAAARLMRPDAWSYLEGVSVDLCTLPATSEGNRGNTVIALLPALTFNGRVTIPGVVPPTISSVADVSGWVEGVTETIRSGNWVVGLDLSPWYTQG